MSTLITLAKGGGKGGGQQGGKGAPGPNWPSRTGNPSGGDRGKQPAQEVGRWATGVESARLRSSAAR